MYLFSVAFLTFFGAELEGEGKGLNGEIGSGGNKRTEEQRLWRGGERKKEEIQNRNK